MSLASCDSAGTALRKGAIVFRYEESEGVWEARRQPRTPAVRPPTEHQTRRRGQLTTADRIQDRPEHPGGVARPTSRAHSHEGHRG
jgi:hypothetical protein